jgi:hypothetical protein
MTSIENGMTPKEPPECGCEKIHIIICCNLRRSVYPDIIVHKRGEEKNNDKDFDREKILRYTSPDYENNLNYELGALIIFSTGKGEKSHEIEWYENGQKI